MGGGHYNERGHWERTKFCMFPCGDRCDCMPPGDEWYCRAYDMQVTGKKRGALPGGQYYSMQPDGHNMLCNADGTRSIFDDVDE